MAFSMDVVDLFYSIPHAQLLTCVKACITEQNDECAFINSCGISTDSFLELLTFYLSSTVVGWNDQVYVQRSGICIGSRVAPVLCDIFFSCIGDNVLANDLDGMVVKIFRYVDDYLVVTKKDNFMHQMINVVKCFKEKGLGLTFTGKSPVESKIQFLELSLTFNEQHVCWE